MFITNQILIKIGKKIRERRQELGLKLHEIVEEAQISKGLLSKIENGRTIPSLPVLLSIIKTLKVDLGNFFNGLEVSNNGNYILKKRAEYSTVEKEEAIGFSYLSILTQNISNTIMEAVILNLAPNSKRDKVTTDGFEFKFMLKGTVQYHIGEEVVVLEEGDSLFFNGKVPHVPVNTTDCEVSMLVIYFLLAGEAGV